MMIYGQCYNLAFSVGDFYGQEFPVGESFDPEKYHPVIHYGNNYLLTVGDDITQIHFDCPQLAGITEAQLLAVLIDRISHRARVDSNVTNLICADLKLREAMRNLEALYD